MVVISTYTDIHKNSYEKHKEKNLTRMKVYYQLNKETLKAKRRARYLKNKQLILKNKIDANV